jgi:hypothetical protein
MKRFTNLLKQPITTSLKARPLFGVSFAAIAIFTSEVSRWLKGRISACYGKTKLRHGRPFALAGKMKGAPGENRQLSVQAACKRQSVVCLDD